MLERSHEPPEQWEPWERITSELGALYFHTLMGEIGKLPLEDGLKHVVGLSLATSLFTSIVASIYEMNAKQAGRKCLTPEEVYERVIDPLRKIIADLGLTT